MSTTTAFEERLLTEVQVAERFQIRAYTLTKWRATWPGDCRGPRFTKIGNRIRYRLVDVIAYEENNLALNE